MNTPSISNPLYPPRQPSKQEETPQNQSNNHLVLDLSLCRNDFDQISNKIDKYNMNEAPNLEKPPQGNEGEPRVFSCNYCQRKFYSSQALGGHQNAHKRERTLAKRGRRMSSTTFANYYPENLFKGRSLTTLPYPSKITTLPLHGACNNNRPLGIQAHSLIHKPSNNSPFSSAISLHHGWSRMPMIDQQRPAVGRLGIGSPDSSSSPKGGGIARFGSVQKNSQASLDINVGGISWKGISINVVKSSGGDHDKLHKLDLSLRL